MAGGANPVKAIIYALGANFAIAVSKYTAAFFTGSSSMLAEAVHSTADCGNQLLLLLGVKLAKRAPTPEHPLGFGKETYFWSFMVALMLFSVGGLFSLYEGWHKLHETGEIAYPGVALGVLGFGIVAEGFSMWGALREIDKMRGSKSLWRWFRTSRNAELVVIFGEDLAALLGLVLAFGAVLASWLTGNPAFDAMGSMAIGVLLIVVAIMLAVELKALLIGQGVEQETHDEMVALIEKQPEVVKVLSLLTLQMGSQVTVAVKAEMAEVPSARAVAEAINRVEVVFRTAFPEVQFLFFEPDIRP